MTRNRLHTLIKQAKSTAKDKAMAAAALAGKPTSTGIAAGASLGTILAALGAISRSGEDPNKVSILSNPLLLGALGATGGYLAGNAFDNAPTKRARKDISGLALAGILGGGGTLGTMLAKEDALELLHGLRDANGRHVLDSTGNAVLRGSSRLFDNYASRLNSKWNAGLREFTDLGSLTPDELKEFSKAQKEYVTHLRRAGKYPEAARLGGIGPESSMLGRLIDKVVNHPASPISWGRSLRNLAMRGTLLKALVGPESVVKVNGNVLERMGNILRRPGTRVPAALAGLALLAGGGKALYDKLSD